MKAACRAHPSFRAAEEALQRGASFQVGGLWGASSALFLASLRPPASLLVLAPSEDAGADLLDALLAFGCAATAFQETPSRLLALRRLLEKGIVVASASALEIPVPTPEGLLASILRLRVGDALDPHELMKRLDAAGLQRTESVETPGECARHGGILDVHPPSEPLPFRIEWEGDRIASLRSFNPETQRSGEAQKEVSLLLMPPGKDAERGNLLDHLPADAWVAICDPALFWEKDQAKALRRELGKRPCLSLAPLPFPAPFANAGVGSAERARSGHGDGWTVAADLPGRIAEGFHWPDLKLSVPSTVSARRTDPRPLPASRPIESFLDLKRGDFVVHFLHGIGRFRGLQNLKGPDGIPGEFLALEYADAAVLYVPVSQIDLVQKYVGSGAARPRLSKVGERRWAAAKLQASQATEALAAEMLRLQALRDTLPRPPYPEDEALQGQFDAGFPFTLTGDQARALEEIRRDLGSASPMDRLLCGDVGYGKTELAMRAAFQAVAAGRQVAVLVPTTLLAQQHGETFSKRLGPFAVKVETLSRLQPRVAQRRTLKRLAAGELDLVVGTHRLLQNDVHFRDLGVLVVDEEQRFGVVHKQKLRKLRATVDVLTLTATPIPRTLHTALLGIRAISNLAVAPAGRQAVRTTVCPYAEEVLAEALRRELARGGQAFVVHNRVHSIQAFAGVVRRLAPEARIRVGHGQMPPGELKAAMHDFVTGRADVLVCTTIIESGLDIPEANTLIVHDAHRYGLADLHQLRGRVGRSDRLAHAFFLLPEKTSVRGTAAKRLKAIEEFCELGAGFHIALRDLEIRGAGNLLGAEQSGHIAAVGYELYCRLLERSVKKLKGEAVPEEEEPVIEVPVEAYLPETYLPDPKHRMEQYRLLARATQDEEIRSIEQGWRDRAGDPPLPARSLLDRHRLRLTLPRYGVTRVRQISEGLLLRFKELEMAKPFLAFLGGRVRPQEEGEVLVAMGPAEVWESLLKAM